MTTSGRAGKPAERRAAEADTPLSADPPTDPAAAGDMPETAPHAEPGVAASDDVDELKQQIEQTREQLGETVEQLAAKADVKSRVQAKAAELAGRVKSSTAQTQTQAATQAGNVRSQLAGKTAAARQKAISVGGTGQNQLQTRAAAMGAPVWEATPEQVRRAVAKGACAAKQHRMPLAGAVAALILGYLAIRQWRKR
jgi:Protein of unknown function (DUF3618)